MRRAGPLGSADSRCHRQPTSPPVPITPDAPVRPGGGLAARAAAPAAPVAALDSALNPALCYSYPPADSAGLGAVAPLYMPATPVEFSLELTPRARVDVFDVRREVFARHGDALNQYPR